MKILWIPVCLALALVAWLAMVIAVAVTVLIVSPVMRLARFWKRKRDPGAGPAELAPPRDRQRTRD